MNNKIFFDSEIIFLNPFLEYQIINPTIIVRNAHQSSKWLYFMWHFVLFFASQTYLWWSFICISLTWCVSDCILHKSNIFYWISSFHLLSKQRMLSYTLPLVILPCCIPKAVMIIKQTFSSLIISDNTHKSFFLSDWQLLVMIECMWLKLLLE